ncbi:hypothetical protein DD238_006996 [Peronospora effusa]|uniref:Uncharacterized protein n=1 Tax=Peronospora effusa TaxID=542832 RepID=A0A3M6VBH9_9STRA|nr:hypothetical protein DD238_006996 [Peronospora effusa]RQM14436.1 hypothetical protein DD237_005662 [Peronospora effusa]
MSCNVQKVISDQEFAEAIMSNVLQTHREMVMQFSKHYDPVDQRLTPSSAQVMNALRAESELASHFSLTPDIVLICYLDSARRLGLITCHTYHTVQVSVAVL